MMIRVKCDWCGREFEKRSCIHSTHNYCSKIPVICEWCGHEFLKKRSDIARSKHNFCSRGCYEDYINLKRPANGNQAGERLYRYLAGKAIGRPLTPDEEVHHIDGNHDNNSPDNLMVVTASEHGKIHAAQKERAANGRFIKKN